MLLEVFDPQDSADKRYERLDLEVYSDEIFEVIDPRDHSKWVYIGVLFIPLSEKESCLQILKNYRCLKYEDWSDTEHECSHMCGFHDKNNTEVHYKEIHKLDTRFKIACRWIEYISSSACARSKKVFFNILGINLTKLNLDQFGTDSDRVLTIYNRFYRTALLGGLKYFFKNYGTIAIHKIYHDDGSQKNHKYCPWHSIYKINIRTEHITILDYEIEFINSDHRKSNMDESQFIQLVDILLGAVYSCLHSDPKRKYQKRKIGYLFKPTLETLLDRRKHESHGAMIGSYYQSYYYRTYQVTFFPCEKMDIDRLQQRFDFDHLTEDQPLERDYFYYERPIVVSDPDQSDLSNWF